MSELLHPGRHPDADQLSAFAEHVLLEHERLETLAHLAECPDCRQIVFLAQQAQEEVAPVLKALPSGTSWLRGWRLLWPVAAAVTCGLLIFPLAHRRRPEAAQGPAIALESKQQMPLASAPPPPPAVSGPPTSLKAPGKVISSLHAYHPSTQAGAVAGSINGNPPASLLASKPSVFDHDASPVEQSTDALSANTQLTGGAVGGPVPQAAPSQTQKANLLTSRQKQSTALQSQDQLFPQQAAASRGLSNSVHGEMQQSANQTVSVQAAPPVIQTESATLSTSSYSNKALQAKTAPPSLPSNRPTASTISNGVETVAIDSAGDLFVSKDAGVRWQRVARQWTGKAVRVSLASPTMARPLAGETPSGDARASTSVETAMSTTNTRKVGFDLVNDSGVIWSSPDGLVWKQSTASRP
jgi:hypothetical protein